jgi:pimeloyl-ACP methyl ester carboxylesterase
MKRLQAGAGAGDNLFLHDFQVCDRYAGGLEAAAQVGCPVTMILGQHDQMTPPRGAREIAAALKARVATVPSGHHQLAETPDATLAALRTALA